MISYTSYGPQKDVGNYVGLYVMRAKGMGDLANMLVMGFIRFKVRVDKAY